MAVKNAVLEYNFQAQNVYLVMRSSDGSPKKVKVTLDGEDPGQSLAEKT